MPHVTDLITKSDAVAPYFLGLDVGGTSIKLGIVDDAGFTVRRTSIPTEQEKGPENACLRMANVARELAEQSEIQFTEVEYVGLATPGTMDLARGVLLQPHNLRAWWDFPIQAHLREVMHKPVEFANDAGAAAYGEFWIGSGAEHNSMVLFTLGTGVGGGIIIDGKSIDGQHSHGSECGHTYIASGTSARKCGCGQRGHLEAYTSAKAVIARTQEALQMGRESSIAGRIAGGEQLTPLMVSEEAERDDRLALEIVMNTAEYLSLGIVNMMHTIDPDAIILGGAMNFGGTKTELGRRFLERIRNEVRMRAFPALAEVTCIDFATLGGFAGYIGAAGLARSKYQETS